MVCAIMCAFSLPKIIVKIGFTEIHLALENRKNTMYKFSTGRELEKRKRFCYSNYKYTVGVFAKTI